MAPARMAINVVGRALRVLAYAHDTLSGGWGFDVGSPKVAPMTPIPHVPVMLEEVLKALAPKPGELMVDATFGAGGYTRALLESGAKVIAFDRDPTAIAAGKANFARFSTNLTLVESPFGAMVEKVRARGIAKVDGVVFDLGVSSMQLDEAERGFSFRLDGPLDMRMSGSGTSAADLVNGLDEKVLADILFRYGEEKHSRAIARMIVRRRAQTPFTRTRDLAEAIAAITGKPGPERIHPATRSFQGLRIAVNRELDEIAAGLAGAEELLAPGGRLVAVTFHSLEDRLVKRFLGERAVETRSSRHAPEIAQIPLSFALLQRGVREPSARETADNARARSAKLRSASRTPAPPIPLDRQALGLWSFEDAPKRNGRGR